MVFSFSNIAIDATYQEQVKWIRILRSDSTSRASRQGSATAQHDQHLGHRSRPEWPPNPKVTSADEKADEIMKASRWSMRLYTAASKINADADG
jgi:hypothetical protein